MTANADYKEAQEKRYEGGGLLVIPLSSGAFAVYGYGTQLFGIVKEPYPSFLRAAYRKTQEDYDASQAASAAFRKRAGEQPTPAKSLTPTTTRNQPKPPKITVNIEDLFKP